MASTNTSFTINLGHALPTQTDSNSDSDIDSDNSHDGLSAGIVPTNSPTVSRHGSFSNASSSSCRSSATLVCVNSWLRDSYLSNAADRVSRMAIGSPRFTMAILPFGAISHLVNNWHAVLRGPQDFLPVLARTGSGFVGVRRKLATWPLTGSREVASMSVWGL